ncbi:hypothetical protein [Novosphingobium sp. Rr 2-17]|uniref:hypothetical protein n=1 Tax=Novosphingobium sp. Rr 2-17 TaxID=555793 RepID=UPI0005B7F64C|nr:hypothetical protein [Novosphingobium sp. Rr 2-17]
MSKLTLRYEFDPSFFDPRLSRDDFGTLSISVVTDRFSGSGRFWVQWQDVKEFGEALGAYPITQDRPVIGQWGYDKQEGDDLILRIEVSPADARGNLIVRFEVAERSEDPGRVKGSFLTNYQDLQAFRIGIAQLMKNEVEHAVLTGQ